jgi:protein-S-isoprenylcysteine O-methyltransferase Ste14
VKAQSARKRKSMKRSTVFNSSILLGRPFQVGSNFLLALIFSLAVIYLAKQYVISGQLSIIFNIIFYSLSVVCALFRKPATKVDLSFFSWLFTFAGIALPMLLFPDGANESLIGYIVQISGIAISIIGLVSLNRSFGLVAAHRGIVSKGLYRFVRHPLYFSYEISIVGFIINNFNFWNIFLFCVHICCQLQRIKYEEDLLSEDGEYRQYATKTKWRLIPFLY